MPVTKQDLLAVADATIEAFKDKYPRLKHGVVVKFTKRRNGCCYPHRKRIHIPLRELTSKEGWAMHTMIHELAHIAAPLGAHHNKVFRAIEIDMCEPWGIELSHYARAYAKKICYNGAVVYDTTKRKTTRRRAKRTYPNPEWDARLKACKTGRELEALYADMTKNNFDLINRRSRTRAYEVNIYKTWVEYYLYSYGSCDIEKLYRNFYVG